MKGRCKWYMDGWEGARVVWLGGKVQGVIQYTYVDEWEGRGATYWWERFRSLRTIYGWVGR